MRRFACAVNGCENSIGSQFIESTLEGVEAHPNKYWFAYDVSSRYKTPHSAVGRIVAIIAHHPKVVLIEGVRIGYFAIDDKLTVVLF